MADHMLARNKKEYTMSILEICLWSKLATLGPPYLAEEKFDFVELAAFHTRGILEKFGLGVG
jgi:hypothetical protein